MIAHLLHSVGLGGAELLALQLARALSGDYRFVFICLDERGTGAEDLLPEDASLHVLNRRPGVDWGCAMRLARALARDHIDLVHAHQYTPFFYAALARCGAPLVRLILTEHGRHYPDRVSWRRQVLNRFVLRRAAHATTAVCEFCAQRLIHHDGFAGSPVRLIENGIDLAKYQRQCTREQLRDELGLAIHRRYVLNVGRHHPIKAQDVLLRAFRDVARQYADVDLLLVGEGPAHQDLRQLARELQINDRVYFLGARRDVPRILAACDIFALTSVSEAAPLTILEAMAAKLPIVASAVGGVPELLGPGVDGLLVPPGDCAALGSALIQVLERPQLAESLADSANRRVQERYRFEQMVAKYRDLYAEMLHGA